MKATTDEETQAQKAVDQFLQNLSDDALQALDKISLQSGRAAYSVYSLNRLNRRMHDEGLNLHDARKKEFGVDDSWKPAPNPLGTPTGNPAVDRTISIASRWIQACEKRWGKPETVAIEHVREGFSSPKKARKDQQEADKRYRANASLREQVVSAMSEPGDDGVRGPESVRFAEIRRLQAVQRQNNKCIYCGKEITFYTAQMDHIVPRKGPGCSNDLANLVAACADCNAKKNNTLFYRWASEEKRNEVLSRIDTWIEDGYMSDKQYIKDVKSRLLQKEEDEPLDVRSIESVAWMARELREQIEGHFHYRQVTFDHVGGNDEFGLQRVTVYRGSVTAAARRASGLENALPWIGGTGGKTRLDRRHHAVDAAVIALMRPGVGKVLIEREALRREQIDSNIAKEEQGRLYGKRFWRNYEGTGKENELYLHWRDCQMDALKNLLCKGMEHDRIVVTNYKRLRLGNSRAHEDTVFPLIKRKVGDALSPINIDKAETPALWKALTSHPDFDPEHGLPKDDNRRIRVRGKTLSAQDEIGFMARSESEFDVVKDAVYAPVRGGFAAIGNSIHHARFYRIPKTNAKGNITGYQFAYLRVFQFDLLKHRKENLFEVDLPPQSISRRSAHPKLRAALDQNTAEYLGWAVVGDEMEIDQAHPYFSPDGKSAINLFMKAFPATKRFKIIGFPMRDQIKLEPLEMSSEGLAEINNAGASVAAKVYGGHQWNDKDTKSINTVLGIGGSYHPSVDLLLNTLPRIIRRNTLGEIRWKSSNNMPTSWSVPPHPEIE